MFFKNLDHYLSSLIRYSFYALFFLTPLILTPLNYELFEFNKMVTVYFFTLLITCAWLMRMTLQKKILLRRTYLDIPLLLFLIFNFLSFVFSIDRHTSLFGYYSRFNAGLLSIISYLLLYYAFVSNLNTKNVYGVLRLTFCSATLVAAYGILEHFGIDKNLWVQDVQNRVFSTLGQPNWLAAYLVLILPLAIALNLRNDFYKKLSIIYYLLSIICFSCLLFTKSRSGLLGFIVAYLLFWLLIFIKEKKKYLSQFLIFTFSFLILASATGTPWTPSLSQLFQRLTHHPQPTLEVGGTESGNIRQIVWQGAWKIFLSNPVLGTGPETFAYAYYWFRPVEHNLTSEWDFLYNKAHNEYLNYLATTGILGFSSYLFIIVSFVIWSLKRIKAPRSKTNCHSCESGYPCHSCESRNLYRFRVKARNDKRIELCTLNFALLSGFLGILVSQFFGFSIVITNLFFFLFPALALLLDEKENPTLKTSSKISLKFLVPQYFGFFIISFALCALSFTLVKYWLADYHFATARSLSKTGRFEEARHEFTQAINANRSEPLFQVEAADNLSQLALETQDTSQRQKDIDQAVNLTRRGLQISPYNLNNLKVASRVYYRLSQDNQQYLLESFKILITVSQLAPTDAKTFYNLALLYGQLGDNDKAIETLQNTLRMKEDYQDAWYALSLFYEETKQKDKAIQALENLLKWYPNDEKSKEKLESLKNK